MYLPKADIYNCLKELELTNTNLKVYQTRPETFKTIPVITFSLSENACNYDLANNIGYQEIIVQVDVWSNSSTSVSELIDDVEEAMRNIFYQLSSCYDVDNIDSSIRHSVLRFTTKI